MKCGFLLLSLLLFLSFIPLSAQSDGSVPPEIVTGLLSRIETLKEKAKSLELSLKLQTVYSNKLKEKLSEYNELMTEWAILKDELQKSLQSLSGLYGQAKSELQTALNELEPLQKDLKNLKTLYDRCASDRDAWMWGTVAAGTIAAVAIVIAAVK